MQRIGIASRRGELIFQEEYGSCRYDLGTARSMSVHQSILQFGFSSIEHDEGKMR